MTLHCFFLRGKKKKPANPSSSPGTALSSPLLLFLFAVLVLLISSERSSQCAAFSYGKHHHKEFVPGASSSSSSQDDKLFPPPPRHDQHDPSTEGELDESLFTPQMQEVMKTLPSEALKDGKTFNDHLQQRFGVVDLANPLSDELTNENFDSVLEGNEYVAVMFYRPSDKITSARLNWEKLVLMLRDIPVWLKLDVRVASFNIARPMHKAIAERFSFLPTTLASFKLFRRGKYLTNLNGEASADEWKKFIINTVTPSCPELETQEMVAQWKRRHIPGTSTIKILGLFEKDDAELQKFKSIASVLRDSAKFAYVRSQELFERAARIDSRKAVGHDVKNPMHGSIIMLKDIDDRVVKYEGKLTVKRMDEFIVDRSVRLLTDMNAGKNELVESFMAHPASKLLVFLNNRKLFEASHLDLLKLASELRGENFVVGYANADEGQFPFNVFSVQEEETTAMVLSKGKRYFLPIGRKVLPKYEQLMAFVNDVEEGVVKPRMRSGEPPLKNNGPVKVVVAHQYEELVARQENQDTFLALVNDDCDHPQCKKFLRLLRDLAQRLAREKDRILVARMDYNENEVDGIVTDVLPSLLFFSSQDKRAGKKVPMSNVSRKLWSLAGLLDFLRSHTSHEALDIDDANSPADSSPRMNGDDVTPEANSSSTAKSAGERVATRSTQLMEGEGESSKYLFGGCVLLALAVIVAGGLRMHAVYRRKRLRQWLTSFMEEHDPEHITQVESILDAYSGYRNGESRLKEDIRKMYTKEAAETKKSR